MRKNYDTSPLPEHCYAVLPSSGQQLDQIPPRRQHALIPVHQNPQAAGCWNLLRLHKVSREILSNLTAQQRDAAHIRFFHIEVPDDGQRTVLADGSPHVQLPIASQRQLHRRLLHSAPDVALII